MDLNTVFDEAIERRASDIHLAVGNPACLRVSGDLIKLDAVPYDRASLTGLLEPILTPEAKTRIESGLPYETTVNHGDRAFIGIAFRAADNSMAATFRILADQIPPLDKIAEDALPVLQQIARAPRGLAILAGLTGSGKTTTLLSVVESINTTRPARIFVVEAHASYNLTSKRSLLTRHQVGLDCDSYERVMDIALQADLDVMAMDDIPTSEVLRQTLLLAESGHLVIANLHADGVLDAIQRMMLATDPEDEAFRRALAKNLIAVVSQQLFRRAEGRGWLPAYEWITNTPEVSSALAAGELGRVEELLDSDPAFQPIGRSVERLRSEGRIST